MGWVWVIIWRVWKCNDQRKKAIAREDFPPMPEPVCTEARNVQWMLVVMETLVGGSRVKEISDKLPFDGAVHTETIGYVGGLWLL